MRILVLEPWDGGSHRVFLDGWLARSSHKFTRLGLLPRRWKWRMRHSAMTFAEEVARRHRGGEEWDVIFCSDMLDLAAFRGLAPPEVGRLPAVVYFHENQLTYPVREEAERDLHFAFTNLTTALAADAVWWNSAFHRDEYLGALSRMSARMPDHQPKRAAGIIREKSRVEPPGVNSPLPAMPKPPRPSGDLHRNLHKNIHIVWVARWEFDKDPETFFAALLRLQREEVPFRLSVLGEQFQQVPEVFARARRELAEHPYAGRIEHWGFVERREDYLAILARADVVVSTARHEFFGLAVVEAIAAGCYPLLPERLAYPEILAPLAAEDRERFFFDGTKSHLVERLSQLAEGVAVGELWGGREDVCVQAVERFAWSRRGPALDAAMDRVVGIPISAPSATSARYTRLGRR